MTKPGFLIHRAIDDFAVSRRAIWKIGCLIQKSLISFISIKELTKIEEANALTFFLEIKAKIALPELKTFFFPEI